MLKIALAPPPLQNSPAPVLPQAPSLAAPVLPQALAPANDRLFPNDRLLAKSDYVYGHRELGEVHAPIYPVADGVEAHGDPHTAGHSDLGPPGGLGG